LSGRRFLHGPVDLPTLEIPAEVPRSMTADVGRLPDHGSSPCYSMTDSRSILGYDPRLGTAEILKMAVEDVGVVRSYGHI
jgi:hypothetical protein